MLADATRYVIDHQVPDFTCVQITRRLEDRGEAGWLPIETVIERLTYFDRRESYKVLEINGIPASVTDTQLQGARLSGEFGSILRSIFLPRTRTEFSWQGWVTLRGMRMQAYGYHVNAFRSRYHFELPEESLDLVTAYHGIVFLDDKHHFVHRITLYADDIPPSLFIQDVSFTLDYDYTRLGRTDYMLPLRFELSLRDRKGLSRHVVDYASYDEIDAVSSTPEVPSHQ